MNRRLRTTALAVAAVAALALAGIANAAHDQVVYTLSNSASGNAVLAYSHPSSGVLSPLTVGGYATGGLGTGAPLGSQGAVVTSKNGKRLFAVNAGDDTISMFAVGPGGSLQLKAVAPSGGSTPISLTTNDKMLYVLNAGGTPSITGFRIRGKSLDPLAGSTRPLGAGDAGPAQVQFSPRGTQLVVTNKASSTIDTYLVGHDGLATGPVVTPSTGSTPFGFDFDAKGHVLVSNAEGTATSYSVGGGGALSVITGPVDTHQGAPCWLVTTPDGRYAYTTNTATGNVTGFSVARSGALALLDPSGVSATIGAGSGPIDEEVSSDGQTLFVLSSGLNEVRALRIGTGGDLLADAAVGGLPAGAAGMAAG